MEALIVLLVAVVLTGLFLYFENRRIRRRLQTVTERVEMLDVVTPRALTFIPEEEMFTSEIEGGCDGCAGYLTAVMNAQIEELERMRDDDHCLVCNSYLESTYRYRLQELLDERE